MKIKGIAALLSVSLMGICVAAQDAKAPAAPEVKSAELKTPAATDAKKPEVPYVPLKKISISPAIPLGGVKELTQAQYENNVKDLATVTQGLKDIKESQMEATKGDKEQEALLKERQAYLSFIVKSYECYNEVKARCEDSADDKE